MTAAPRFLDAGECALVVEFGSVIDEALAARVLALDAALAADPPEGLRELVPTYRSLMIHYDPLVLDRAALVAHVAARLPAAAAPAAAARLWRLPVCYDPACAGGMAAEVAADQAHVAAACGMTPDAVIALHAGATFRLVMYGFAPGWAYLSGLPPALRLPRRDSPRPLIPGGSVIVAGGQAVIAGGPMPSGWHILGLTPARLFDPARTPPLSVEVGDSLRPDPVDAASFAALAGRAAAGETLVRPG